MAMAARGQLRIYLGAAPGVGKTFAMLNEGRRRIERGEDVVCGFVESHGRARTAAQIGELEVVPRRQIAYRDRVFEEMDIDALLARRPEVALVDELAHTNVPGSRNEKRWQDVEELLDAGINVISTLNIQHLESLNDVIAQITGVTQQETIPDAIVRQADQMQLVDVAPETVRARLARGDIYPAERIDTALGNYFRAGNLGGLRELALLWIADQVEEGLKEYRERHGISEPWETRERVLVALSGSERGERLIRRAARMAQRGGSELVAVHVRPQDGLAGPALDRLRAQKELVGSLGGSVRELVGADVGQALVEAARTLNATQIILGATRRGRLSELLRGSVINNVIRLSGASIDVHVISNEEDGEAEALEPEPEPEPIRSGRPRSLPRRRIAIGFACAAVGLPLLTVRAHRAREPRDASQHPASLPAAGDDRLGRRRPLAGARRGDRRRPARQLVLHAAAAHLQHRSRAEPARALRLSGRRRSLLQLRRAGRQARDRGRAGPRRGRSVPVVVGIHPR